MNFFNYQLKSLVQRLLLSIFILNLNLNLAFSQEPFNQLPHHNADKNEQRPLKKILLIGESLSSDYKIRHSESWMNQLEQRIQKELPGWALINISMPSNTIRSANRQINSQLKKHDPTIVFIQLGNNDALRASAVRHIKEDLKKLIIKIKAKNSAVMLIGSSIPNNLGQNYAKRFVEMYQILAISENTGLVPDLLAKVSSDTSQLTADGIHANPQGHQQVLKNAWEPIRDFIHCIELHVTTPHKCAYETPEDSIEKQVRQ